MNPPAAQREYDRAAELRAGAFELLDQHLRGAAAERDQNVIVELQDAANHLGAVERLLRNRLCPAPPGPSLDRPASSFASSDTAVRAPERPRSTTAAIFLMLAETVVPYASSRADGAERWLRIMREHGSVGEALANLGMASGQLSTPSMGPGTRHPDPEPVAAVASDAAWFAAQRNAPAIAGVDVLFAVMRQYGSLFDRALYSATSKQRDDLLASLEALDSRVGM